MARRRRKFGRLDNCWRKNVRGTSFLSKKGRGEKVTARRRRKFGGRYSYWRENVRGASCLSKKGRTEKQWPAAGEIFLGGCQECFLGGRGQIWLSRGLAILVVRWVWTPPRPPPTPTYARAAYSGYGIKSVDPRKYIDNYQMVLF